MVKYLNDNEHNYGKRNHLAKINKSNNFPIIRNILGIMDGASRMTWRCKSVLTVLSNDAVALEDLR